MAKFWYIERPGEFEFPDESRVYYPYRMNALRAARTWAHDIAYTDQVVEVWEFDVLPWPPNKEHATRMMNGHDFVRHPVKIKDVRGRQPLEEEIE